MNTTMNTNHPTHAANPAALTIARTHQAKALVSLSLRHRWEKGMGSTPTGQSLHAMNATRHRIDLAEQCSSRFTQRDRVHDLDEAADTLAAMSASLVAAREAALYAPGEPPDAETDAALARLPARLAELLAARLVPAVQCIAAHLPMPARVEAARELESILNRVLAHLDATAAQWPGMDAERELWRSEAGMLDAALLCVVAVCVRAGTLGMSVEANEALAGRSGRAVQRLEELSNCHGRAMRGCVAQWLLGDAVLATQVDDMTARGMDVARCEGSVLDLLAGAPLK